MPRGGDNKACMHVMMVMQTTPSRLCMLAAYPLHPRQLQHALQCLSTLAEGSNLAAFAFRACSLLLSFLKDTLCLRMPVAPVFEVLGLCLVFQGAAELVSWQSALNLCLLVLQVCMLTMSAS